MVRGLPMVDWELHRLATTKKRGPANRAKSAAQASPVAPAGRSWQKLLVGLVLASIAAAITFALSTSGTDGTDTEPLVPTQERQAVPAATPHVNDTPAPGEAPNGMVWIPGGVFWMGTEDPTTMVCGGTDPMNDARPVHLVAVDGFWMDATEVTNEQFERFVKATGYVTVAEKTPRQEDFPDAPPENLVAGSIVFTPTAGPVPLDNHLRWWR